MDNRMESQAQTEMVAVHLANHPRMDYLDILHGMIGDFPVSWAYTVPSPMDMDQEDEVESMDGVTIGVSAEAQIDLSGPHAVVKLNPNFYADSPEEGLTAEAERVLLQWATAMRNPLSNVAEEEEEDME